MSVEVRCLEDCTYKLLMTHPAQMAELHINEPREAYKDDIQTETYLYRASGKESKFNIAFSIIRFQNDSKHSHSEEDLKKMISVYHETDKLKFGSSDASTMKPLMEQYDPENLRINLQYPVKAGFYIIQLNTIGQLYHYRIEVSTTNVMVIPSGRPMVSLIEKNETEHVFEFYPHLSGSIFAKVSKCFGDVMYSISNSNQAG